MKESYTIVGRFILLTEPVQLYIPLREADRTCSNWPDWSESNCGVYYKNRPLSIKALKKITDLFRNKDAGDDIHELFAVKQMTFDGEVIDQRLVDQMRKITKAFGEYVSETRITENTRVILT